MKKIILILLSLVIVAGAFGLYTFYHGAVKVPDPDRPYFYVADGSTVTSIRNDLVDQKIISGKGFNLVSRILRFRKARPGRYRLTAGMSLYKLVKMLRNGEQSEVKVTIVKERLLTTFAGKFGRGKKFDLATDSAAMIGYLQSNDSLKPLGVDTNSVLSIILPLTYSIRWNSTPEQIMQKFSTASGKFWTTARKEKADSLQLTPQEVITLASIVEEETNRKSDKPKIASTYLNRLRAGMPLQADPTIKYAMKNFALKRILSSYLDTPSPYNTYLHAGLPPGPICTPAIETIDAVLNAPATDYLYFVASDKFDGSSVFTTNLADHHKFAKLYQDELTRRMDSAKNAKH